ncbi:MAG TPA: N-acetylmuramoyl-L-alanine amidase [Prolixibacteraceae bacterium]|nr:N-acetylmuramoyl-L-alanine amidase [Prolixibacteraceae bacterium]
MKVILISFCWLLLFCNLVSAQNLNGVKIYINPGHGGFDPATDRNVIIAPFSAGDTAGFWESKSNLVKGIYLRKLLEAAGATVYMSRTANRNEDDRPLSAIAEEANANRVDFMISVHSNAFNSVTNYTLMLYHGWDNNPILPQSLDVANLFWEYLSSNQIAHWTYTNRNVRGDKSFAPSSWNGYGVLRPLTVPGLISEGSFHDYIPETYRLMNDDYKRLEAWHHYLAFSQYYGGNPGKKGKIAGFVKDSTRQVSGYAFAAGTKDQWHPVNGATVTLTPGDLTYTIDQMNNGFFVFDNLMPGTYHLKAEAAPYKTVYSPELRVDSAKVTYHAFYLFPHTVQNREKASLSTALDQAEIFPNPAHDELVIRNTGFQGMIRYYISDLSGRIVSNGTFQGLDHRIGISQLSTGSYLLVLYRDGIAIRRLFVKK